MFRRLSVVFGLLLIALFFRPGIGNCRNIQENLAALVKAKQLLESNQLDSVISLLEHHDVGVLNPYSQWLVANAYFQLQNYKVADQILSRLLADYLDFPLRSHIVGLSAQCQYYLGDYQLCTMKLQLFLQRFPGHPMAAECTLTLARCLAQEHRTQDALSIYLDIFSDYPNFPEYGSAVNEYIQLSTSLGTNPYAVEAGQLLGWARGDLTYGRYTHLLQLGTEYDNSARLGNADTNIEIKWLEAQALEQLKRTQAARAQYQLIITEHPESTWASRSLAALMKTECKNDRPDRASGFLKEMSTQVPESVELSDAKVVLGKALYWDGEYRKARSVLARLLAHFDDPGHRSDALWYLGWSEWKSKRYYQAEHYWEMLQDDYPQSSYYPGAMFWNARALQKTQRQPEAQGLLNDLARRFPQTFHGIMARVELNHLSVGNPTSMSIPMDADAELHPFPAAADSSKSALRYRILVELGILDFAIMEGESLATRTNYPDWECQKALLEWKMGLRWKGYLKARKTLETPRLPSGLVAPVIYPLTFADLISEATGRWSVSPGWILALIRQESGFDTTAISEDGAVGLLQVLPSTARWITSKYQLPDWARLSNPTINVTIGTAYFNQLLDQFNGAVLPAVAAFNAGPGVVNKWLQVSGSDLAEWVDSIPYMETRNFVKRVVINAWTYAQLYPEQSLFLP